MNYPFEPKSNRHLEPGQYWGVPLSNGRFACGRVLSIAADPDPFIPVGSRMFLAGLLRWVGTQLPTGPAIAGAPILRQGFAHVRTVRENGRFILGVRPLELDGLMPYLWRTHKYGRDVWVYQGDRPIRPAELTDASLPVMSTWGYSVIKRLADHGFVAGQRSSD